MPVEGTSHSSDCCREADRIENGKRGVFAGYTAFKELMWLTLPFLLITHIAAIAFVLKRHGSLVIDSAGDYSIRAYLSPGLHVQQETPSTYIYAQSFKMHLVFLGLGVCAMLMNVLSASMFECLDPMVRTTIANYKASAAVQWCQALISATAVGVVNAIVELLRRDDPEARAQCVYNCLMELTTQTETSQESRLIHVWQTNSGTRRYNHRGQTKTNAWRRVLFYFLHLPILVAASIPAVGFVLAKNVPAEEHPFLLTLVGNSATIAIVQLGSCSFQSEQL